MLEVFGDLIGQTIEAYIDDIIVTSRKASSLVANLDKTFQSLRVKGIKLNPKNVFLGFLKACALASLSLNEGSRPIKRKSQPSQIWAQFVISRGCRG